MAGLVAFLRASVRLVFRGGRSYWLWMSFLLVLILQAAPAYLHQLEVGLIATRMRDSVSWGFFIGNFTFLVGVAAAGIMLVIPAYIYEWKPIREVVIYGEFLAIASIAMCLCFVLVDVGRPERVWHMLPFLGTPNFPSSLLAWDALVLNAYLVLNTVVVGHLLYCAQQKRDYNHHLIVPLVLLSIPAAIGIHTVTAFLYNGMASRPYWNSAILAPRFLASAFCSGPAVLVILFQVLRRVSRFEIRDEAIQKIAELMAYAMGFNLFLLGAELFKEYYSHTHHLVHFEYLFGTSPIHSSSIAVYGWASVILAIASFLLFVVPSTRKNPYTMNLGCVMIYASVYIEKGIALIIPGYTPDTLGQVYHYAPNLHELRVAAGIFGIGFLLFTILVKLSLGILEEGAAPEPTSGAPA